jgi:hypothetical protein
MGNLIQRNRGKRGAPDVTRNLSTGKVTTTYRDPRKKGSLGLRVTKSHDSNGNVHTTESFNYGGGVTKKSRTKQNKAPTFGSGTTRRTRSRGSGIQMPAMPVDMQFAMLLILGGLSLVGFAIYYAIVYWYISIPLIGLAWYYFSDKEEDTSETEEEA